MAFAAIPRLIERGDLAEHESVVVLSTSSGMKDPEFADEWLPPVRQITPSLAELERHLS